MPTRTDAPAHAMPQLAIGRYRLTFQDPAARTTTASLGSAWRGAFGHALKHAVCVTHQPRVCALHALPRLHIPLRVRDPAASRC